jgi:uncharacterized YigZ family protein
MTDEYTTIAAAAHAETKVKGSRFLALLAPAESADAAVAVLDSVRKARHDASHHCFAYRLGPDGSRERFSDAGEPSGTAGRPILHALQHAGLSDVVLVVTRYFGGTKLGVGGLRRAYADAARAVIGQARTFARTLTDEVLVLVPAPLVGDVMSAAARAGGKVIATAYAEQQDPGTAGMSPEGAGTITNAAGRPGRPWGGPGVRITIEVRRSQAGEVRRQVIDRTSGAARILEA